VAERAGVTHGTIPNLEKMPAPWDKVSFGTPRGLAKAFGVSEDTMFQVARGGERSTEADRDISEVVLSEGKLVSASGWVDPNWLRLDLMDPSSLRTGGQPVKRGHVYVSAFNFEPPHNPETTLALRVEDDYLATWRAKNHPGVSYQVHLLTSTLLAGNGEDVVAAFNRPTGMTVLYLASEAGAEESALGVSDSKQHQVVTLPSSNAPRFEDEDWLVIGPVFSFVR
jgi:transcriptional regulator with XRE-family HTH domain